MAKTTSNDEYDFIIVGGGTAGLALATRLTEDPKAQILVLEAGDDHLNDPNINVPALWPSLLGSEVDWDFATVPQKNLDNRVIGHPLGRTLGGSSALNAQAFIAPAEAGIDLWEELGNSGWDWKTMLPYYKKCHTLTVPPREVCEHLGLEYLMEGKYRAESGPIQVSYTGTSEDSLSKAWVDTFRALSYTLTSDPFKGRSTGGFANPTSVNPVTKERSYSASAYYAPVKGRVNLKIETGAQVERILFEAKTDPVIASGVRMNQNGTTYTFKARKEVILTAGTFNSCKLLELSGIGDASLLKSHGIEVLIDNPNVGENLQDHPMTGVSFEVNDDVTTLDDLNRQDIQAVQAGMEAYQTTKTGPFSGGAVNSFAFMPVVDFQSTDGKAALKHVLEICPPSTSDSGHRREYEFVRDVISSVDKSSAAYFMYAAQCNFGADGSRAKDVTITQGAGRYITVAVHLSYPLSRGSAHISSASAADKPVIDPRYLSHPLDMEIHARHVRFIDKIVEKQPLASFLKPNGKRVPGFAKVGPELDAAKNYLRQTMVSGWHPVGTCPMLPRDKGGVVNEKLKVYGSQNVRVVDASIMPVISRGNTQTTVYAIAERAADLIKEDYGML